METEQEDLNGSCCRLQFVFYWMAT